LNLFFLVNPVEPTAKIQAAMDFMHILGTGESTLGWVEMLERHLTISGTCPDMLPVALNTEVWTLLESVLFTALGVMMCAEVAPAIPASLGILRRNFHSVFTTPYIRA
jgi:hypothetical protein